MPYLLDTNSFIQPYRTCYSFGLCPGFWTFIDHHGQHDVISIDKVLKEIQNGKEGDDLTSWVDNCGIQFCSTDDAGVVHIYGEIMAWVQNNQMFKPAAKAEFADVADGWVVAYARAQGCTLVTGEKYEPQIKKKVKIPNICRDLYNGGVEYIDVFEMLIRLGAKFHWNGPHG